MKTKFFIFAIAIACFFMTSCGEDKSCDETLQIQKSEENVFDFVEKDAKFFQGGKQIVVDTVKVLVVTPINYEFQKGNSADSYVVYTGKCILLDNGKVVKTVLLNTTRLEGETMWNFVSEDDEVIVTGKDLLVKNITLSKKID